MYSTIYNTHKVVVILFLLIYLIKTVMLLINKTEQLEKFTKVVKVPEMIISFLFLATGVYMLTQIPVINNLLIIKIVAVLVSIPLAVIGFKKKNKALAAISLLLIITAYGLAEMSKKKAAKGDQEVVGVSGEEIYIAKCALCHGNDGKLGQMAATDLSSSSLDHATLIEVINKGRGAMVGFEGALTSEQVEAVAQHVESLR